MKVGAFLLVGFGAIVIAITYLSGLYREQGIDYWIEFDESILGLYEGGMVEYLGVPVGKVTEIYVTEQKKAHVTVTIDPEKVTLQEGVQAELVIYSLAAGTMAISLSGGDPSNPVVPPNSQIPANPSIIAAVGEQIEDLIGNINSITKVISDGMEGMESGDLNAIVEKVSGLLDDSTGVLDDGRDLVTELTDTVAELREQSQPVIDEATALSRDMRDLSKDVQELVRKATEKLDQVDVNAAQEDMQRVLRNMADLSEKVNAAMSEFDNMTANVLHEAGNVEFTLRRSLQELGHTLESMRVFIDSLNENPSSLIRGRGERREAP